MEFIKNLVELNPVMPYIILFVGFVMLVKGADLFVDGSASLARKLGISAAIVGLTIVAMGTSAPEAAVSISGGIQETFFGQEGKIDMAIGNIIGSNLFNLLFILGISMMIHPIPTSKDFLKRDFPWAVLTTLLFIPMIWDGKLVLWEGIALLALFVIYIGWMIYKSIKNREVGEEIKTISMPKSIIFLLVGLIMIVLGSQFVLESAQNIAYTFGMSSTLVGLTICAIGTSLPELVTSFIAARKGESEIAIGNVVGSNIFNLLFILGTTITISNPMPSNFNFLIDTIILLFATALVYLFAYTRKRCGRIEGATIFIIYLGYFAYIIIRDLPAIMA